MKAVIPAGQTESTPFDIRGFRSFAIEMPDAWTAADITFRASRTGVPGTFKEVTKIDGTPLKVTAAAGKMIVGLEALAPLGHLKIVSSVAQGADRELYILGGG